VPEGFQEKKSNNGNGTSPSASNIDVKGHFLTVPGTKQFRFGNEIKFTQKKLL